MPNLRLETEIRIRGLLIVHEPGAAMINDNVVGVYHIGGSDFSG